MPAIAPAGIINAAGPDAGRLGCCGLDHFHLRPESVYNDGRLVPPIPLAQAIGNVTITVNSILMPLIFVSPEQINAQVPVELAPGAYTLTVQSLGQQPVSGSFTVSRNAPGIFVEPNAQNIPLGAALHQDGTLITLSSPARRNEIVSLYGTGFGPLEQDRHATVSPRRCKPLNPTTDTVTLNAGGVTVPATWAGAAPTLVGTDIVQLEIVDGIPSATTINLVVTVNGKPSAAVELPVQ